MAQYGSAQYGRKHGQKETDAKCTNQSTTKKPLSYAAEPESHT